MSQSKKQNVTSIAMIAMIVSLVGTNAYAIRGHMDGYACIAGGQVGMCGDDGVSCNASNGSCSINVNGVFYTGDTKKQKIKIESKKATKLINSKQLKNKANKQMINKNSAQKIKK